MKKILFIDRDGTIIHEPENDQQVDSLEKLSFMPKVISCLEKISRLTEYVLVMVSNQDGLGTSSFPEDTFWPAQNKMLEILRGEGIEFKAIHIDRSFEHENSPNRKPGTGMLKEYIVGDFDLKNSFVIGDRFTDLELAKNLGAKSILYGKLNSEEAVICTSDWEMISQYLIFEQRKGIVKRKTSETEIRVEINLDGSGNTDINTGLGFFDHMLDQIGKHGEFDMMIKVKGDLEVDEHHTIEDTGIALGEAFAKALSDKKGIQRYGFLLPMDDALAQVAIDFGGRPWFEWNASFKREKIGDMPTEMFFHFFKSFTDHAKCNLNIIASGNNEHHKIESIFKAFARAAKMAVLRDEFRFNRIPSTKGIF
jgi:imidazoleglycerol-phosphate dehydratase/histidinol-phosphatase